MSTFKIQKSSVSNNVAHSRSEVKLTIDGNTLSGNILDAGVELPFIATCEDGLIFTCTDNSQYLPLI